MEPIPQEIDQERLASLLKTMSSVELFLLNAQLTRLYDIWMNEEGQPEEWSTKLIHRRNGAKSSTPDISKETILMLSRIGTYDIESQDNNSYSITTTGNKFSRLLWSVNTATRQARKQQIISFKPTGEAFSTDGSGSVQLPVWYTLENKEANLAHIMESEQTYANVARIMHEKYQLGDLVLYDTLCEELDAIPHQYGLGIRKQSHSKEKKREAVRQAGVRLRRIADKTLLTPNYIVIYNTGLMRTA